MFSRILFVLVTVAYATQFSKSDSQFSKSDYQYDYEYDIYDYQFAQTGEEQHPELAGGFPEAANEMDQKEEIEKGEIGRNEIEEEEKKNEKKIKVKLWRKKKKLREMK